MRRTFCTSSSTVCRRRESLGSVMPGHGQVGRRQGNQVYPIQRRDGFNVTNTVQIFCHGGEQDLIEVRTCSRQAIEPYPAARVLPAAPRSPSGG